MTAVISKGQISHENAINPHKTVRMTFFTPKGEVEKHKEETYSALAHFRCIRTRTHKLIENYNDCIELYDLENDPEETTNIIEGNSHIGGPLRSRIHARLTEATWNW